MVGYWELEGNWEGFELGCMPVRTLDGKLLGGWLGIPSSLGTEDRETVGKTVGIWELEGNREGIELVMLGVTDTVFDGIALDDTSVGKLEGKAIGKGMRDSSLVGLNEGNWEAAGELAASSLLGNWLGTSNLSEGFSEGNIVSGTVDGDRLLLGSGLGI